MRDIATSIATSEDGAPPQRGRPPTAAHCALAVVTAGLAVAAVMLAMAGAARASSRAALPEEGPYIQGPSTTVSYARAAPTPASTADSWRSPSAPAPVTTAAPQPTPEPTPPPPFMAMPVDGVWQVVCGYRCGLHNEEHAATFALDIARVDGETAGQAVRSPLPGRIIAVKDSSTYVCRGEEIEGPEAGSVIIIDFQAPSGATQRLRLVHLDPATIPDELKPDGSPVPVDAGAPLGAVAMMEPCSHLHISLTRVEAGQEVPEPLVIEGTPLEDCDEEDCWRDTQVPLAER